jgi:hypothetical protein
VVLQLQFAFFEAAQLQLVVVTVGDQYIYDSVEVAMFHVELDQAALNVLHVSHFFRVPGIYLAATRVRGSEAHYNLKHNR